MDSVVCIMRFSFSVFNSGSFIGAKVTAIMLPGPTTASRVADQIRQKWLWGERETTRRSGSQSREKAEETGEHCWKDFWCLIYLTGSCLIITQGRKSSVRQIYKALDNNGLSFSSIPVALISLLCSLLTLSHGGVWQIWRHMCWGVPPCWCRFGQLCIS